MDTPQKNPESEAYQSVPEPEKPQQVRGSVWYAIGAIMIGVGAGLLYLFFSSEQTGTITQTAQTEPIVFAGISPLTGDAASFGQPIRQAALLAQREINAAGGIGGRPIEMQWHDGKCEGEDAEAAARTILADERVQVAVAGVCSNEFLASAPLFQERAVISISPSATSPLISDLGPYVIRTAPSDALAGRVAAQYARERMEASTAAVITEDTLYTEGLRDVFIPEFEALGGTIVVNESYETGTIDFSSFVASVVATEPDVIYILPQSPTPGVLITQALKEAGVTARLLTAEVMLIRDAIVEQAAILEGVTGIEVLFDEENPHAQEMLARYEAEFGLEAIYPSFMASMYDLMYLLKEAFENTDGSPNAIDAYLKSVTEWPGASGVITFDENGDPLPIYSVRTISDGEAPIVELFEISR